MAAELGAARISVGLDTSKVAGEIKRAFSGVDADGAAAGKAAGGGFAGGFKSLVGPALAVAGSAIFGGFIAEAARASDATDKFKSTMNFAGLDTSAIDAATKSAKSYADETVYELSDIQKTMATLAANGVDDYTGITKAAGNLNAVAGGNAETFKSVSLALGQSAGAGKLMAEDWNMLADAIPGASGQLQDAMREAGAFEGNFKKAMENGEISAEEFQTAISKLGSDPIAVEAARSVTTFEGALGNLSATVNGGLMAGLDELKPVITGAINGVASGLQVGFDWIGNAWAGLRDILVSGDYTGALREAFGLEEDNPAVSWLLQTHDIVMEGIPALWDLIANGNYSGAMLKAFALDEDSPAVDWILKTRDAVQSGLQELRGVFSGFTVPPMDQGVGGFFAGLIESGAGVRDKLIAVVAKAIPGVLGAIVAAAPAILSAAVQSFTSLVTAVTAVIPPLLTALLGMLPTIIPVILGMIPVLLDAGLQLFQGLVQAVVVALPQIVAALVDMLPQVASALLGMLPQIVDAGLGLFMGLVQAVVKLLPILIDAVMDLLPSIISTLLGMLPAIIDSALELFLGVVTGLLQALPTIISALLGMLPQLISTLVGMIPQLIQAAVQLFNGIVKALPIILPQLIAALVGIGPQMVSTLVGMVPLLVRAGVDLVGGLVRGIASAAGSVGRALIDIAGGGIEAFKSFLGIHSPSRVFMGFGLNIGQGLILGIDGMHDKVAASVTGLVSVPSAPSFGPSSYTADLSPAGGPSIYVQNPFTGEYLLAQVGSVASGVVQSVDSNSQYRRAGRI